MENLKISSILAHNIRLLRNEEGFIESEKASIADAFYGILMAKANLEKETEIIEKLEVASEVLMSYLFYLDIMKKE